MSGGMSRPVSGGFPVSETSLVPQRSVEGAEGKIKRGGRARRRWLGHQHESLGRQTAHSPQRPENPQ